MSDDPFADLQKLLDAQNQYHALWRYTLKVEGLMIKLALITVAVLLLITVILALVFWQVFPLVLGVGVMVNSVVFSLFFCGTQIWKALYMRANTRG